MSGEPHYLEIVTPNPEAVCAVYAATWGVAFDAPAEQLGSARVALLPGGARVGVRAPLRPDEDPICRIYLRVDDLDAATAAARDAGATVALDGMELGGHGRISIVIAGGVEHGLWQLPPGE